MDGRFALQIEYDGTNFVGWQRQAQGVSVQSVLEAAAARLTAGERVEAASAGRTDAGVHASGQVVLLIVPAGSRAAALGAPKLRDALNYHLKPFPVAVVQAAPAPLGWHARFSAVGRAYRYTLLNRVARPALNANHVWHVPQPLDADAMAEGARALIGRHDFTSFRARSCQGGSPLRTLDRLDVARSGDHIVLRAEARSFLQHQVRTIVGTLALVGVGRQAPDWPAQVLLARDRGAAGQTAPPDGLELISVRYAIDPFAGSTLSRLLKNGVDGEW